MDFEKTAQTMRLKKALSESFDQDVGLAKQANWLRRGWNYAKRNPWSTLGNVALTAASVIPVTAPFAWAGRGVQVARAGHALHKANKAYKLTSAANKMYKGKNVAQSAANAKKARDRFAAAGKAYDKRMHSFTGKPGQFKTDWAKPGLINKSKALTTGSHRFLSQGANYGNFKNMSRLRQAGTVGVTGLNASAVGGTVYQGAKMLTGSTKAVKAPATGTLPKTSPIPVTGGGGASGKGRRRRYQEAPSPYGSGGGGYKPPSNPYGGGGYKPPSNPYGN